MTAQTSENFYRIIDIEQGSAEWHSLRESYIGSSDAPCIMGISPYRSALELWEERMGLRPRQTKTSAMERGHAMEAELRDKHRPPGEDWFPRVVVSKVYPWMLASLDALTEDGLTAAEFKALKKEHHEAIKRGEPPEYVWCQIQHQLAVLGLNCLLLISRGADDGSDDAMLTVIRDDDYIEELAEKERIFMEHLNNLTPPPMGDGDYMPLGGVHWENLEANIIHAKAQADHWKEQYDRLKAEAWDMAGHRNAKGSRVTITAYEKKGPVNYKAIPELNGVDLDAYRKAPTRQYRITITEAV